MKHICRVCGCDLMEDEPYDQFGCPTYVVCPCCGYEYGYDDFHLNISYEKFRKEWKELGYKWLYEKAKPINWNLKEQLNNIGIREEQI